MAGRVGEGKVIALEPDPENFERLKQNIFLNHLKNVTPLNLALSDHAGQARLYHNQHNTGGYCLSPDDNSLDSVEVRLSTLDDVVHSLGLIPDLIKIDVEGHTVPALNGAKDILNRHRPHIVMEVERPKDREIIGSILKSLDYRLETPTRHPSIILAQSSKKN